ncbi:MAG TPA: DinB family protein [Blastocatellia bacterium]|nr:DinB family protein [Blastocatellia bacterium]
MRHSGPATAGSLALSLVLLLAPGTGFARSQQPPTPGQSVSRNFDSVNRRILEMARDFPADKYDYRPAKDVRSFGEVIVHVISGNVYAAKAGRGEKAEWDELNPKDYKGKAGIVAALEKSISDANATLKNTPEERFTRTLSPWLAVIEHAAEHYGQLVVYYRSNGMVPPASRPPAK